MTEELIIRLVDPAPLSARRTACRRGHPFVEGSYYLKQVFVKGKHYVVRDCIACNLHRQSQYRKRKKFLAETCK